MNECGLRPLLVVEDSDEDFTTLQRLLQKQPVKPGPVYRCSDGDEALDFLYRQGHYTDPQASPRPVAVLLDLNLPGTDGRDVLRQIKQDEKLKKIPIVIFSTSDDPVDVEYCYRSGANGYLVKPMDLSALQRTIDALARYWLAANLPPAKLD